MQIALKDRRMLLIYMDCYLFFQKIWLFTRVIDEKNKKVKPVSGEIKQSQIEIERSSPPGIKECAGIVSRDVTNKSGGRELLTFYCLNYLERDPRGS